MLDQARRTLEIEVEAIQGLIRRLDERFQAAVRLLLEARGKSVVCGIGKSGAVARKLASTLASTGTPAHFLHPAEAVHGDLGTITVDDVVIMLSHSGETEEVVRLLPHVRRVGARVIALCGQADSTLGRESDVVLDVSVPREACPLNLAPTASVAAMLAMGDALAMAAMSARGFSSEDFAASHPAGSLGKQLLRARDLMHHGADNPVATPDMRLRDVSAIMSSSALRGVVSIVDGAGRLVGVLTDGDLRRLMQREGADPRDLPVGEVMTRDPTVVREDQLAAEVARIFEERELDNVPVVDSEGRAIGVIDVQDLLKARVL